MARITWEHSRASSPGGGAQREAHQPALFQPEARDLGGEAHLPAQGDNLPPDGAHHPRKLIRADVGLGLVEDFLGGAGGHQLLQHLADAAVPGAGGELAIGEGAGAALPKLDVGLGIQHPLLPEALNGALPLLHGLAPLQDNGLLAALGQEQARRTSPPGQSPPPPAAGAACQPGAADSGRAPPFARRCPGGGRGACSRPPGWRPPPRRQSGRCPFSGRPRISCTAALARWRFPAGAAAWPRPVSNPPPGSPGAVSAL